MRLPLSKALMAPAGVTGNDMLLGCNMAWINSYSARVFANLMLQVSTIEQAAGSGAYTINRGDLTATVGTDKFRFKLADDASGLPSFNLTIYNPNGCSIKIGDFNVPSSGWTTSTQFTATVNAGQGVVALWSQGSMSGVQVVYTDHVASWQAGNPWHSSFIAWHTALGTKVIRTMDMSSASVSMETIWADRALMTSTTLGIPANNNNCAVPWELLCDLANRLKADLWLCVPPRADATYRANLVSLIAANLNRPLRARVETGNEIWNSAAPWATNTNWVGYLQFTKYTATANAGANSYTMVGHGFSNSNTIAGFDTVDNRTALAANLDFRIRYGNTAYVKVLDANTFQIYAESSLTTLINVAAGQVNLIYVKPAEAGKTFDIDGQYAALALQNWSMFDAAMGASRVVHILGTQVVTTSRTTSRLAVPGVSAACHCVHGAPYFAGLNWAVSASVSSGAIVPAVWASQTATVKISVWPQGATVTDAKLASGTGAISFQSLSYSYNSFGTTYTNATSVGSLTNGTAYDVWFYITDTGGRTWKLLVTVTVSATPSTTYTFDTYANQAMRDNFSLIDGIGWVQAQIAVLPSTIKMICYEGGGGYDGSTPSNFSTWYAGYQQSSNFAKVINDYLYCLSGAGAKQFNYYGDMLSTSRSLTTIAQVAAFTDPRAIAYAAFKGSVPNKQLVSVANQTPANILVQPTFPYTLATLPAGLTYTIVNGDINGNYQISGNLLQMANDTDVAYNVPVNMTLTIAATDGYTWCKFLAQFSTGDAWYQNDAIFAFSTVVDTDTAAVNPTIGSSLPRTVGSGAAVSGDLWDMDGNCYGAVTGMTATIQNSKSFLVAMVLDRDNQSGGFQTVLSLGGGNFFSFYTASTVSTNFSIRYFVNLSWDIVLHFVTSGNVPTGKHVYWAFWDINTKILTVGIDQTNGQTSSTDISAQTITQNLYYGGNSSGAGSNMKHGSLQVVNRAGMTLADAKAAVAKMQTYHSIP